MRVLSQVVFVTLLVSTHTAFAQDPCGSAVAHLDGCRGLCELPEIGTDYCHGVISELTSALTADCNAESASQTLQSSCAGLVRGSSGVASGNICMRAGQHFIDCIQQECVRDPEMMLCSSIAEISQSMQEFEYCDDSDAAEAQDLLSQSCDELVGMFR